MWCDDLFMLLSYNGYFYNKMNTVVEDRAQITEVKILLSSYEHMNKCLYLYLEEVCLKFNQYQPEHFVYSFYLLFFSWMVPLDPNELTINVYQINQSKNRLKYLSQNPSEENEMQEHVETQ